MKTLTWTAPAGTRFFPPPARWAAALAVVAVLFVLSGSGRAVGSDHASPGAFIRLDDFNKTYPPGKILGKWKARYLLPFFGKGERAFIQFVDKGPGQHYIHLASGKDNWFSIGWDVPFRAKDWPVLEWEWKIGKFPEGGDVRIAEKDDQAGVICFIIGYGTFGYDSALCYLYENSGPKNKLILHRKNKNTRFYFLRTREADGGKRWYKERRNIFQDYREAFGVSPKKKGLIVLLIDSDSTKTAAEVFYRNLYQRKK